MEKRGTNFAVDLAPLADAAVFVGEYPFSGFASATWAETLEHLAALGVRQGIVSPIEAVFREDSEQIERRLADTLSDSPQWRVFKTVDPMKSWWRRELLAFIKDQSFVGVRLFSLYHGYSLDSPRATEVFDLAAEHRLPVQVFCRMQDVRMEYAHKATEPTREEVLHVVQRGRMGNTLLLSGLNIHMVTQVFETKNVSENIFFDTSRMQGHWKTFETPPAEMIKRHLVFGSLWPINCPECPLTQLQYANLDPALREAVVRGNFERFLKINPTLS